jgi:SAM-dependent methyltransferase
MMDVKDSEPGKNSAEWEKRSARYGASLKSVLFKGMPDVANEHLHHSHLDFILGCLKDAKENIRILDVGCGYGRLSVPLIKAFPKADILGMDMSHHYVKLYRENTRREAFVGTMEAIPPDIGAFDCVIAVTVFMYMERVLAGKAVANLLAHLNPGGKLIIIEPSASGIPYQTAFGLLNLFRRQSSSAPVNTGGVCFETGELDQMIASASGTIVKEQRIPATTFFFLAIYLMGTLLPARVAATVLRWISAIDNLLKSKKLPTLWTFHLATKK